MLVLGEPVIDVGSFSRHQTLDRGVDDLLLGFRVWDEQPRDLLQQARDVSGLGRLQFLEDRLEFLVTSVIRMPVLPESTVVVAITVVSRPRRRGSRQTLGADEPGRPRSASLTLRRRTS